MNRLFCAESVVVVGVSESTDNLGKNVVANLVNFGYQGKIYAVGPRGGEVFGHPVYRSIAELPGNPELAVILTPARFVHDMLAQCGEKGTRWAVIESAGFRELGTEGEMLERGNTENKQKVRHPLCRPQLHRHWEYCQRALHPVCRFWRSPSGEAKSVYSLKAAELGFALPRGYAPPG